MMTFGESLDQCLTDSLHNMATHPKTAIVPTYQVEEAHTNPFLRQRKTYKKKDNRPFVAWDGEGYTDENGEHHYMLFGCSDGEYIKGESLTGAQCFDLMLTVARKRKAHHVIFSGGYDVVMMIRHYPTKVVQRILNSQPTWYGGFRHEYFKGKYLRLSNGTHSITLYDVFTFFSTSFVRACREYLGDHPDFDRIESTKLKRDKFTESDLETEILPYMQQELKYLVQLCDILKKRLNDAGIELTQWHGPGAVASAVLKQRGIKAHMATNDERIAEAARYAYFGGRFEQFRIGYTQDKVYQYDIRSAYPFAISRLPSLAGITWVNRQRKRNTFNTYGLYKVSYHATDRMTLDKPGPLPWRDKNGNIYYPHDIHSGWYWGIELQATQRHQTGELTILDAWEPKTDPADFPFTWVAEMYNERARMKKEGNPTQLALKLAMNSLYGKLAQSKGAKLNPDGTWRIPTYHQLEWAGWITAASRAKLYDAMMQAGSSLIAVETDAVYSTKPLDLPCSPKLGDWEEEIAEAIMYVQSGVYFKKKDGKWALKSRGFEPRNHTFEAWFNVMSRLPADKEATVTINLRRFGSVPTSDQFARWYEMQRTSTILQMNSKRVHLESECIWCDRHHTMTEFMHTLIVPQFLLDCEHIMSAPHKLPWIDVGYSPPQNEWVITEEEFSELDFL